MKSIQVMLLVLVVGLLAGCGREDDATTPATVAGGGQGAGGCWTEDQVVARDEDGNPSQWSVAPAMTIDPAQDYTALIETSAGSIRIELLPEIAPITVNNFVCLARAGYFDGTPSHRIIEGFVVQAGDPTGTGSGGPGYRFPDEPVQGEYLPGAVAMANAGPNTNGSQFFLILDDLTTRLPKNYNLFGRVISGQDVLAALGQTPVKASERGELSVPIEPVTLERVTITEGTAIAGTPAA